LRYNIINSLYHYEIALTDKSFNRNPARQNIADAYHAGMDSAKFGDSFDDCPYLDGTDEAKWWREGYSDIGEQYRGRTTREELVSALELDVQVVSFRADRMRDVQVLYHRLVMAFAEGAVSLRVERPYVDPDRHIQLWLTRRVSIERVFQEMCQVPEGQTMCRSLRAMPLAENSLRLRESAEEPADWTA
jgi:hypothetical protein